MNEESITYITFLVLSGLSGVYVTVLLCRNAGQRVGWRRSLLGAFVSALLSIAVLGLGLSITHGEFGKGATVLRILSWAFTWGFGCALIPAVLVVWFYRRKRGI
jgi:hypothetical protein